MNMTADKFALSLARFGFSNPYQVIIPFSSFLESRIPKASDDVIFYVATPTQERVEIDKNRRLPQITTVYLE